MARQDRLSRHDLAGLISLAEELVSLSPSLKHSPDHRAFTLLELLVSVAILAILAGLLLPAINKSREQAKSAGCLGNQRQIAAAMISYCGENNGRLPEQQTTEGGEPFTWRARLVPYLGENKSMKTFLCPSDKIGLQSLQPPYSLDYINRTGVMPCSYGPAVVWYRLPNSSLPYPGAYRSGDYRISGISNPAKTLFLTDTGRPDSISAPPDQWKESARSPRTQFIESVMPSSYYGGAWTAFPRHGGGKVNGAFFDGHAESIPLQQLRDHTPGDPECLYWPYR